MVDILHRVGVLTPTPERVYEALTTAEGLAGWWTEDVKGSGEVGGVLEFRFPPVGGFDMEVLALQPSERVSWPGIWGPDGRVGSTDALSPRPGGDTTAGHFRSQGWGGAGGGMPHCTTTGGSFLVRR